MIDNHPMLNETVQYDVDDKHLHGTVTGVRRGSPRTNRKTWAITHTIELRIKPDDGSRAFWTPPMEDEK